LPDLPAVRPLSDGGPEHSRRRRLRPFLFYGTLQLCKLPHLISPHRRHQLYRLPWRMGLHPQGAVPMVPYPVPVPGAGRTGTAAEAEPYFLSDTGPRECSRYKICDWARHNTVLEYNAPCQKDTGFFFLPVSVAT